MLIMTDKMHKKKHMCRISALSLISLVMSVLLAAMSSCQPSEKDDRTMTQSLLESYMNALCKFDISSINKNNLLQTEDYSDSDDVKTACRVIAEKISWEINDININGSTAIAQVTIVIPSDISDICNSALNDAMIMIEQGNDATPSELIRTSIQTRLSESKTTTVSSEISMSKVGNKWYISKSPDVITIISDIRTPVAAVYSIIDK